MDNKSAILPTRVKLTVISAKNSENDGKKMFYVFPFLFQVSDYWMYKFRNVSDTSYAWANTTNAVLTPLQKKWNSYLSIASMIPNVTFLLLNAAFGHRFRYFCILCFLKTLA